MKKVLFLTIVLLFIFSSSNGQFLDNLESYTDGVLECNSIWGNSENENCLLPSSDQARTGILSGYITNNGSSNTILDLGNKIFGEWYLQFYVYIPTGGEALCYIQGAMEESAVGNIYFNKDGANPGVGFLDWATPDISDDTYFNFPHDTWFRVGVFVDISTGITLATWGFSIDDVIIVEEGTPFADGNGNRPTALGSIVFVSSSNNSEFYFDDFCYETIFNGNVSDCFPLSINEIGLPNISIYPNPIYDSLFIDSTIPINSIKIFSTLGKVLLEENLNFENIDVRDFTPSTYILEIETKNNVFTKKIIKI